MTDNRPPDYNAAQSLAVQEIGRGHNVMFMDNHSRPDHLSVLTDPSFLEQAQQAARRGGRNVSVLLEASPETVRQFRELQQSGLNELQLRDAIRERGLHSSHAENHGYGEQSVEQTASLIHTTGRLGIPLMGHDHGMTQESAAMNGRDRISPDALTASPGDQQIARDAAAEAGNNVVIGFYGRDHFLSFNDLDEQLTQATGRSTRVFMLDDHGGGRAIDSMDHRSMRQTQQDYNGNIDPPDYIYRDGEARRMNPDVLTNDRCVDSRNWMSNECSTQVQGAGRTLRRAGLDPSELENVSMAELGSLAPLQTPGKERSQEVGLV